MKKRYTDGENYRKEVLAICDSMAQHLIGVFPTPDGKAAFPNVQNAAFQRFVKNYPFRYNVYPLSEMQQISENIKKSVADHSPHQNSFLEIPIGRVGSKPVLWEFGDKNQCFNGFIAGAVGTGKSSFLQHLILSIAEKHSPAEFRFWIMDFKHGNEFNTFKDLPHLELLLLDNSRLEIGIQILKNFFDEIEKRSEVFAGLKKKLNKPVPNIATYNRLSDEKMPYKLLIIDEVHTLFFGENKSYQKQRDIQHAFQQTVRKGRGYGLHIVLCTQNLEGFDLGEGIMGQIQLRVAFRLSSEKECGHILDYNNTLPLDLGRYEAVLNTQSGRSDAKSGGTKYNTVFKSTYVGDIMARIAAIGEKWEATDYEFFEKIIIEKGKSSPFDKKEGDKNLDNDDFMKEENW